MSSVEELRAAADNLRSNPTRPADVPLANWLDEVADDAVKHAAKGWGNDIDEIATGWPLEVARAINGGAR